MARSQARYVRSIERAQKRLEMNKFEARKRLPLPPHVALADNANRPVSRPSTATARWPTFVPRTRPVEVVQKYMPMRIVGFLMDTTLAEASLAYGGLVQRHPNIRPVNSEGHSPVNFDPACLRMAPEFTGPERILAESDYPRMIGSLEKIKTEVAATDPSDVDRARVAKGTAAELLGVGI